MRDDELQVLGGSRKQNNRNKWKMAFVLLAVAAALGAGLYWAFSPKQPEKIKTGKKMGEPTIVPELQTAVDSILKVKLGEIDGLQGQAIGCHGDGFLTY